MRRPRRMLDGLLTGVTILAAGLLLAPATAEAQGSFTYKQPGDLVAGSGQGRADSKIYVPGMRFPIEESPAYANSQVWGHGGYKGPGGGQCHTDNYSYPWWDNYCEKRSWDMPLCPAGNGHQGQDIRPKTCKDSAHWTVAAEDGTITYIGTYSVILTTASGRKHRYLHMNHNRLAVHQGQTVQKGDRLGLVSDNMGETPTTIHLHYDIKDYVQGVGKVFVPTYMSLVDSYKRLLGGPGIGEDYTADLEVRWQNGSDRYPAGSSKDLPDFFNGDTVEATITLENTSEATWRDVWLGYYFDTPHLRPVDYRIQTDHPEHDRSTWTINDADMAEENPPKDQMGREGKLNLYALSPGETKRIVVTLEAGPYSIGAVDHPDVRAWLWGVKNAYGEQSGYFKQPQTNKFGENIRDFAQLDVLSRDHWHFAGDAKDELEGWTDSGDSETISRNREDDLLAQHVTGPDARLESPGWTAIDADRWDEMVVRFRSHDGPHTKALVWSGAGATQKVTFESEGNSELNTLVLPIGTHGGWTGMIDHLRIDLLEDEAPGGQDRGWYGVADIFFQSSETRTTNSARESYVEQPPVELGVETDGPDNIDKPDDPGVETDTGIGPTGGEPDAGETSYGATTSQSVSTSSCSTTDGRLPPVSMVLATLLLAIGYRRRSGEMARDRSLF